MAVATFPKPPVTIPINETYMWYQGEGPSSGRRAFFIVTQYCPVGCAWCDSKHTWKMTRKADMEMGKLVAKVREVNAKRVIITGGEPLVWRDALEDLVDNLVNKESLIHVDFETSGVYPPLSRHHSLVNYVVTPKPPSAKAKLGPSDENIRKFIERGAAFKFVINEEADLKWAQGFVTRHGIREEKVWIVPQGEFSSELSRKVWWLHTAVPQYFPRANFQTRAILPEEVPTEK